MTPPALVTTSRTLSGITVDPSGQYAYATNGDPFGRGSNTEVHQFTIGTDGSLMAMSTPTVAAGTDPVSIVTTGSWQ